MPVRRLRDTHWAWRIGDPQGRFPIYSGEGAALVEGRWHRKGQEVIYAAEHYATAMLEKLVHYSGVMPPGQHFLKIEIPAGVSYEEVTADSLPGWDQAAGNEARAFGGPWLDEKRSCLLIVPGVVAREERNILINPAHGDFALIKPGGEKPVRWDDRLFPR